MINGNETTASRRMQMKSHPRENSFCTIFDGFVWTSLQKNFNPILNPPLLNQGPQTCQPFIDWLHIVTVNNTDIDPRFYKRIIYCAVVGFLGVISKTNFRTSELAKVKVGETF